MHRVKSSSGKRRRRVRSAGGPQEVSVPQDMLRKALAHLESAVSAFERIAPEFVIRDGKQELADLNSATQSILLAAEETRQAEVLLESIARDFASQVKAIGTNATPEQVTQWREWLSGLKKTADQIELVRSVGVAATEHGMQVLDRMKKLYPAAKFDYERRYKAFQQDAAKLKKQRSRPVLKAITAAYQSVELAEETIDALAQKWDEANAVWRAFLSGAEGIQKALSPTIKGLGLIAVGTFLAWMAFKKR